MYRLVRNNLKGGRDYVHNIVCHRLGGVCVPDVRTRQARTDGAMRGEDCSLTFLVDYFEPYF